MVSNEDPVVHFNFFEMPENEVNGMKKYRG